MKHLSLLFLLPLTLALGEPESSPPPNAAPAASTLESFFSSIGAPAPAPREPEPVAPSALSPAASAPLLIPDAEATYENWKKTRLEPVEAAPANRLIQYGEDVLVTALPGYTTDITLQAGELLKKHFFGDPQGWLSEEAVEGQEIPRVHLLIRPTEFDIRTNLVLITDRRTYRLRLTVPKRQKGSKHAYDFGIAFTYPQEWARRSLAQKQLALEKSERARNARTLSEPLSPTELHFGYELLPERRRSRRLPWRPTTVFDDGNRTFIRLPDDIHHQNLGTLLGRLPTGDTYPLNYTTQRGFLIVGEIFADALFVDGVGKNRRSLRLRRIP